jgi:hypothetical protein
MMVAEAPAWLLDEVNKWMRAFFWAGKEEVKGGQCLVAWRSICQPKEFGGLGIKNIRLQGLALRVRWAWLRRTDPTRPWQGLPSLHDAEATDAFQSMASFILGDGHKIFFWRDRWINGFTAEEIAPEVFALVPTRRKNVCTVADAMRDNGWLDDVEGEMTAGLWEHCLRLWEAVETVERDEMRPDQILWKGSASGEYSAKATNALLCQGSTKWSMYKPVWKSFAPIKGRIDFTCLFIWSILIKNIVISCNAVSIILISIVTQD